MRWGRFWQMLHSLLARRRAYRRKLPNRPVVKPVIGGVIDEQRKIATVLEIIDATHWRGAWNGQTYECRMFPDTTGLTVGDAVVVHAMPNTTELWASYRPPEGGPELWFSPGSDDTNERGQVWRCYPTAGGTQYVDYTIEQVWQGTDDYEYVTHICWAKPATLGYVFTWCANTFMLADYRLRAYRIEQDAVAPSITLVHEVSGAELGIADDSIDPVVDSCQFLNTCYVLCSGMWMASVIQFDLTTETFTTLAWNFPLQNGLGGGIATDSGNGIMYAHDGADLYKTTDAINWDWVLNIWANSSCRDVSAMVEEWTTPQIYGGLFDDADVGEEDAAFTLSEPGEVYAEDYQMPDPTHLGFVALANQWNAAGEVVKTWAQQWGYISGPNPGPEVYVKPVGGVWALDWTGPPNTGPMPGLWADSYIGLATQGIVYFDTQMWYLAWNQRLFSTHEHETVLYRRDAAGAWNLMETWADKIMCSTEAMSTGMAPLPSIGAGAAELAMMRRQHEVN